MNKIKYTPTRECRGSEEKDKGSKGPSVLVSGEVAEEKPNTGRPPTVDAERVTSDIPLPTEPAHTDNRDAFSVFVVHEEEVGPAVS